jgi:hypothetical protein
MRPWLWHSWCTCREKRCGGEFGGTKPPANWSSLICPRSTSHDVRTARARVTNVMDGSHSVRSAPATASWRVPAYVAVPIVVACALLGYGVSLMMPLRPTPADPTLLRPVQSPRTGDLGTSPANSVENLSVVAGSAVSAGPSRDALKVAPAEAQVAAPPTAAAAEAASVRPAPRQVEEPAAEPKVEPSAAKAQEVSHPERQARRVPRKARRVYLRPRPKPPAGPVEALFSVLTK